MPLIQTPLAQVLNPAAQQQMGPAPGNIFAGLNEGMKMKDVLANSAVARDEIGKTRKAKEDLQKLSNIGNTAAIGLQIIKANPEDAADQLRDFGLANKKQLEAAGLPTTETDALLEALESGGVGAAQEMLSDTFNASQAQGWRLPKPNVDAVKFGFAAKVGEKYYRANTTEGGQTEVTDIEVAPPSKGFTINTGGQKHFEKMRWKHFEKVSESGRALDKMLAQITKIGGIIGNTGGAKLGTAGGFAKGVVNAMSAIAGIAQNMGEGTKEFNARDALDEALEGTQLASAAVGNAKLKALLTNLAFAQARLQNPKGVITDIDFKAAVTTIGGNADDENQLLAVVQLLGNNMVKQYKDDLSAESNTWDFDKNQQDKLSTTQIKGIKEFEDFFNVSGATVDPGKVADTTSFMDDEDLGSMSRADVTEMYKTDNKKFLRLKAKWDKAQKQGK